MKKKRLNIVLIIAFILVWGFVLFQFVGSDDKTDKPTTEATLLTNQQKPRKKMAYTVNGTYRDPFLGTYAKPFTPPPVQVTAKVAPQPNPQQPWPSVQYFGLIRNKEMHAEKALLNINGKSYIIHPGKPPKGLGINIMACTKDSLVLSLDKETKTFYLPYKKQI